MQTYSTIPPRGGLKAKPTKGKPKPPMGPKMPMGMINRGR